MGLFDASLHDPWVAVPLVDSTVGGEEVHVSPASYIPDVDSLASLENRWEWVIVVATEDVLSFNEPVRILFFFGEEIFILGILGKGIKVHNCFVGLYLFHA